MVEMTERMRTSLVLDKKVWNEFLKKVEVMKGEKLKKGDISREVQIALYTRWLVYALIEQLMYERELTLTFIAKKIGRKAVKEYLSLLADRLAEFVAGKIEDKSPLGVAFYHKMLGEILYGSKVRVIETGDETVTLEMKICRNLQMALERVRILDKKEYCNACEEYFKTLGRLLGIKVEFEHADTGCKVVLSPQF